MEIKPNDRRILDALLAEINDPNTSDERREEAREDFGGVAEGYLDVLSDADKREIAETGKLAFDPTFFPGGKPWPDDGWRVIE